MEDDTSLSYLNQGVKLVHNNIYGSSSDFENQSYGTIKRRFHRLQALGRNPKYNIDYSGEGTTSEYGLNPSSSECQTSVEISRWSWSLESITKVLLQGFSMTSVINHNFLYLYVP